MHFLTYPRYYNGTPPLNDQHGHSITLVQIAAAVNNIILCAMQPCVLCLAAGSAGHLYVHGLQVSHTVAYTAA